jgi:hypothetical protein
LSGKESAESVGEESALSRENVVRRRCMCLSVVGALEQQKRVEDILPDTAWQPDTNKCTMGRNYYTALTSTSALKLEARIPPTYITESYKEFRL